MTQIPDKLYSITDVIDYIISNFKLSDNQVAYLEDIKKDVANSSDFIIDKFKQIYKRLAIAANSSEDIETFRIILSKDLKYILTSISGEIFHKNLKFINKIYHNKKLRKNDEIKIANLLEEISENQISISELESQNKSINSELLIAVEKIKLQRKSKIKSKKRKDIDVLAKAGSIYIDDIRKSTIRFAEDCRFKNGKINFSELGRKLGVDNKTAKKYCQQFSIAIELF